MRTKEVRVWWFFAAMSILLLHGFITSYYSALEVEGLADKIDKTKITQRQQFLVSLGVEFVGIGWKIMLGGFLFFTLLAIVTFLTTDQRTIGWKKL